MSGFHTATLCATCDPPVVAISTGEGSRCPQCEQVEAWPSSTTDALDVPDGALARMVLQDTAVRSDGDARLLVELARRLLGHVGAALVTHEKELREEMTELLDLADLVRDADISALPPELVAVRQRWFADAYAEEVAKAEEMARAESALSCPHCAAGEPSVWDGELFHYAHPHADSGKLKCCHDPWRERCARCSGTVGTCACVPAEIAP